MKSLLLSSLLGLTIPFLGFAAFQGDIEFTAQEKAQHYKSIPAFTQTAGKCLQWHIDRQEEFWEKYKISAFYGYNSDWADEVKTPMKDKIEYFTRRGLPLELMGELKKISCVNMTLTCLGQAFEAVHEEAIWKKIKAYTMANDQDGGALQLALQKLGWKILYWIPDTSKVKQWDAEEKVRDKKIRQGNEPENQFGYYGYHEERLNTVMKNKMYYDNPVDDIHSLVNFGERLPEKFNSVPFFVGSAHTGFHIFPGKFGYVIEAHNRSRISMKRTVEAGPFDPMGLIPQENNRPEYHPDGGAYGSLKSGLIAVPPGYGY